MTQESDPWTVGRLLTWTTDYLRERDVQNPRLDAEVLLAAALDCERIQLYATFGEVVEETPRSVFREYVKRRAHGEPVAYLVGHREFYSLSFQITPEVLIPRPETELLVMTALDLLKSRGPDATPPRVIDVGTGSGAIAIAIGRYAEACEVLGLDLSPAALEVARANAENHELAPRVQFQHSDLLQAVPETPTWDLIVSNPPYVSEAEFATLSAEVKDYEPRGALVAGLEGDELIRRLIPQAAVRLAAGGWLLIEISPMLADRVERLLLDEDGFESPEILKDLAGHARVVTAQRSPR